MATLLKAPPDGEPALDDTNAVVTEDEAVVLTVDTNGLIRNCNKAAGRLLGCSSSKLVWQHVSNLLPQLACTALMQGGHINPRLRFLSRVGHRFELTKPGGGHESGRIFFTDLENAGRHTVRLIICPDGQHGFEQH